MSSLHCPAGLGLKWSRASVSQVLVLQSAVPISAVPLRFKFTSIHNTVVNRNFLIKEQDTISSRNRWSSATSLLSFSVYNFREKMGLPACTDPARTDLTKGNISSAILKENNSQYLVLSFTYCINVQHASKCKIIKYDRTIKFEIICFNNNY